MDYKKNKSILPGKFILVPMKYSVKCQGIQKVDRMFVLLPQSNTPIVKELPIL